MVSITKGAQVLWQQTIENGNSTGFRYDLTTTVATGDSVNFTINKRADNSCDSTNFDPLISYSAALSWLVADHLGTPRMIFDKSGSLAATKRHDYLPFGEELFAGVGGRTTALGYSADTIRQQFTSYERDNETGLDYAVNRYYGATLGRFTGVDPLMASARVSDPQTWNRYTYCGNNPLRRIDPNGLDWWYDSDAPEAAPVWHDRDPGGSWRRWTSTYTMVYYHNESKQWVALDPYGNRAYIGKSQANAETAFEIFAGQNQDGFISATLAERDFFAGFGSGLSPVGILFLPIYESEGIDTTSREFAWGCGLGAVASFGFGMASNTASTLRVGRWMSQEEYLQMVDSKLVQESTLEGVTSVTLPPNPNAYRDAAARSVFVEFDVPAASVRSR